jgi:hypothetical protein
MRPISQAEQILRQTHPWMWIFFNESDWEILERGFSKTKLRIGGKKDTFFTHIFGKS